MDGDEERAQNVEDDVTEEDVTDENVVEEEQVKVELVEDVHFCFYKHPQAEISHILSTFI